MNYNKLREWLSEKEKPKKPTEFVKFIEGNELRTSGGIPRDWKHVELIQRTNTGCNFDLIIAWDSNKENGSRYLGHWNDGCL